MQTWIDGRFVDWRQANVSLLSHGWGRGVAIFEVINILATADGPAFFCLEEHLDRFFNSAALMKMELALSRTELFEAVLATARQNEVKAGFCKFFGYYPAVEFAPVPKDKRVSVAIFCVDNDYFGLDPQSASRPLSAGVAPYKKLHPETVPLKAKVTGFYVNAYLSAVELAGRGIDDPIFVDTSGFVCEGGTHNNFFVKDGLIKTPPLSRVLEGTTRRVVIEVAREAGHDVEEVDVKIEELAAFEEAFCTGSLIKVAPIRSIDGRVLGQVCPGPVTASVMAAMDRVYKGELKNHRHRLTFVG